MTLLTAGVKYFTHEPTPIQLRNHQHEIKTRLTPPPSPLPSPPHNPFSCLTSLRSLDKNLSQPSSDLSNSHSTSTTSFIGLHRLTLRPDLSDHPHEASEELTWKDSRLIWSKATIVYRILDFSHSENPINNSPHQNHIVQALFATFDHPNSSHPPTNKQQAIPDSDPPSSSSSSAPFQPWSDNRTVKPLSHPSHSPIRALCVLLLDVLKVYFPTGEEYTISIPFPIAHLWPLQRGILAMRKPISIQPMPFIPHHPPSPPINKLRGGKRRVFGGPPDPLVDSMITENETRWWSSVTGLDPHDPQEYSNSQADVEEAQLQRYWAERQEIESSMLWTLSDPCTYYFQPVLTSEQIILSRPSRPIHSTGTDQSFAQAKAPLAPLVSPPRKPGCLLASGRVVFVADHRLEPLHPVCVTASTEGFTVFLCGRLPPNSSEGIVQPSGPPPNAAPDPRVEEMPPPPPPPPAPRSPTPPVIPALAQPQLRRSPRKLASARRDLTGVEHSQAKGTDTHLVSPTHGRPPTRLTSLGHPSLRRSISNAHSRHPSGSAAPLPPGTKKRQGAPVGAIGGMSVNGRRVSNASNASFTFGGASSTSGLRKTSGRKSFVEHQLEIMSGRTAGGSIGPVPMTIDRASVVSATAGFEEWFAGVAEAGQTEGIDGQLADETLDPEWVIQRLQTVEVPDRLR